ncbi:MAG: hypothetical protein JSV36_10420 [Anaerolineae bacterium]|nr:MAG: hypothetical protein JSV36_10420 [Anaerolineae bacterium]
MLKKMGLLTAGLMIVLLVALACNSKSPSALSYTAPFEIGVTAGNFLPGTELQYMGVADGMAEVYIKGQRALKQKADSLSWEGEVREGVSLELDLRVLWFDESTLHVGGTAKVVVKGASVQTATLPEAAALTFGNAPVAYTVKKGAPIPGTLLIYEGRTDEGAKFGGTDDYPYRKSGDSIVWTGTLEDKVWLDLDLRVGVYTDQSLTVAGLASVWIEP